jgi:hypothetical protein
MIDQLIETIAHDGNLPAADASALSVAVTSGEEKGEGFYHAARQLVPGLKHMSSIVISTTLKNEWGCASWKSGNRRGIEFPALAELRGLFDGKHGPQNWPEIDEWGRGS